MEKTLQERVLSLRRKLELLALHPGFFETGTTKHVRDFYEEWLAVNGQCIQKLHETNDANLSFVSEQLRRLLENFPADKTTIGVLEVFPLCSESFFTFGSYINELEQIGKANQTIPT